MKVIIILIIILLLPLSVFGLDMNTIKALSCSYVSDNNFTIDPKKTFDEMTRGSGVKKSNMDLIITDIDLTKGKAKMVGNNGNTEIQVLRSGLGLIFIEMTRFAIHTTVVFDTKTKDMGKSDFPTIQSRNILMFGNGMISQLAGKCKAIFQ